MKKHKTTEPESDPSPVAGRRMSTSWTTAASAVES